LALRVFKVLSCINEYPTNLRRMVTQHDCFRRCVLLKMSLLLSTYIQTCTHTHTHTHTHVHTYMIKSAPGRVVFSSPLLPSLFALAAEAYCEERPEERPGNAPGHAKCAAFAGVCVTVCVYCVFECMCMCACIRVSSWVCCCTRLYERIWHAGALLVQSACFWASLCYDQGVNNNCLHLSEDCVRML